MPPDARDRTWERLVALAPLAGMEPVLQLAADGDWERAAVLPIAAAGAAARDALDVVCAGGDRDLALEVRWPGSVFVGARWPINAVQDVVAAVDRIASSVPPRPLEVLEAAMGGMLGQRLSVVEVGAVNAWRSTGPETIWRRGDPPGRSGLLPGIGDRPDLLMCRHPVAVEFAAQRPRPHWVGIEVSHAIDGAHHVDRAALSRLVAIAVP